MPHHIDPYRYWRRLIAGEHPRYIDSPQPGFWRVRPGKGAGWVPFAIWPEGEDLRAVFGVKAVDPWHWWSMFVEATTEDAYRAKMAGTPYPDEYVTASGETTTDPTRAVLIKPKRRHNGDRQSQDQEATPAGGGRAAGPATDRR